MAADLKLLSKHKTLGMVNAAASIAYLVGPLLGGLVSDASIVETFTISTPFTSFLLCFLCLRVYLCVCLNKLYL